MNNDETDPRSAEEKALRVPTEVLSSDGTNPPASPPANSRNEWLNWLSEMSPRIAYVVFIFFSVLIGRWCGVAPSKGTLGFMRPAAVGALVLASPVLVWIGLYWAFDRLYAPDTTIPSPSVPGQWWLLFNGRPAGPFTSAWLVDAFGHGDLPADSLIAPSGSTEWRAASQWPDWPGGNAMVSMPPTNVPPNM